MEFRDWLLMESSSGLLLAKAVGHEGLNSIKSAGFARQSRHSSTEGEFDKYGDTTTEQQYGPGLYFGIVPNEEFARKNCKDYAETWGGHIVIASLKAESKGLITTWLPENHPIWSFSPVRGRGSDSRPTTYEQIVALDLSAEIPDYGPNNTHSPPEWGYKIHKKIDFWAHEHNGRPHIVVFNPSALQFVSDFKCSITPKTSADKPISSLNKTTSLNNPTRTLSGINPAWAMWANQRSSSATKPARTALAKTRSDDDLSLEEF